MLIHKGYQGSHFDYLGQSRVKSNVSTLQDPKNPSADGVHITSSNQSSATGETTDASITVLI